jgi:hypothetical protein
METIMTNDDDEAARRRDELHKQITEGDTPDVIAATAIMVAREVLPALDDLKRKIAALDDELKRKMNVVNNRLLQSEMALSEIGMVYDHLQALVPPSAAIAIAERKAFFQGRLERFTKEFSLEKYLADKKAQQEAGLSCEQSS